MDVKSFHEHPGVVGRDKVLPEDGEGFALQVALLNSWKVSIIKVQVCTVYKEVLYGLTVFNTQIEQ